MEPDNTDEATMREFGVTYFAPGTTAVYKAKPTNLYDYTAYVGAHEFTLERGDSAFLVDASGNEAWSVRGAGQTVRSERMAVVIRGYMGDTKLRRFNETTTLLPYVNGCSTKQLFPPERVGDPTFQLLNIPPFSAEQAHHIHSTVRVVYIARGIGMSIVGMDKREVRTELVPGMVCVLEPMCPHHFETPQGQHLVCLPVHVFSSVGGAEFNHPMFSGTHLMNQGA